MFSLMWAFSISDVKKCENTPTYVEVLFLYACQMPLYYKIMTQKVDPTVVVKSTVGRDIVGTQLFYTRSA